MKHVKWCLCIVLLVLTMALPLVAQRMRPQPMAVAVMIDVSPPSKNYWSAYQLLLEQVFSELKSGDYVELLTAHAEGATLRFSGYIHGTDAQAAQEFLSCMQDIKPAVFLQSDVGKSFASVRQRLENLHDRQSFASTLIIVLTDGEIRDRGIREFLRQVETCRHHGWAVCITGNGKTDPRLLKAATRDELSWRAISHANPHLWFYDYRQYEPVAVAEPDIFDSVVIEEIEAPRDSSPSISATVTPVSTVTPVTPIPEHDDSESKAPAAHSVGSLTWESQWWLYDQTKPAPEPHLTDPIPLPVVAAAESDSVGQVDEPNAMATEIPVVVDAPEPPQPKPSAPRRIPWATIVLIASVGILLLALGSYLSREVAENRRFQQRVVSKAKQRTDKHADRILLAKYQGRTYRLGPWKKFKRAQMGRGPSNAIRVMDATVAERQLKLSKSGDKGYLQNLGPKPLSVNGSQLKARCKYLVSFPCRVQLGEKSLLTLELQRQEDRQSQAKQEGNYDTTA